MEKYSDFIKELRRRFRSIIIVEYDSCRDSIEVRFEPKTYAKIDNENSKEFASFKEIVYKHYLEYEFKSYGIIEVYED